MGQQRGLDGKDAKSLMNLLIWIAVIIAAIFVLGWILSAMAKSQQNTVIMARPDAVTEVDRAH